MSQLLRRFITDKTIVIAGSVTDNFSTRETSGVIRGFDVNTGKLLWAFDPGAKDPNSIPSDEHTFTFKLTELLGASRL
ncbi:Quinoprotein glucose dehydrogenase [Leclercia adecarboxylata]|uniref:Quinoprotein glucose dehydrogenase n=1 Tax=Leclercia adecarboxylata TaxID=83655 RepID=A0A4U9HLE6_9ENTR|nr:Quinoprotein glucose dehydrogenase [Leclercia adecarboxylata]